MPMPFRSSTALLWIPVFCCAAISFAQEKSAPKSEAKTVPPADRWEKEIAAMEARDRANPPPKEGIVFIGSSSIRLWDLKQAFPELPAVNRGFGGSQMADSLNYAPRILLPLKPRLVVVYAGDNDIKAGKSPAQVHADFDALATLIHRELPHTQIWCLGVKPSPSRWSLIETQRQANKLLRARCEKDSARMLFLDLEPITLGKDGVPDESLFAKDKLHLSPAGYAGWNKLIRDSLAQRNPLAAADK